MYDVAVVGLGAIGSAAALALAERGHRVLGIDRFRPPHGHGSSHGETRMLREAYYHGTPFQPLIETARTRWTGLEARSGRALVTPTPGLMIGRPGGRVFGGALDRPRDAASAIEELAADEVRSRFPAFGLDDGWIAVLERDAGILAVDACLGSMLELAARAGAELRFDTPVTSWSAGRGVVEITMASGDVRARRLVLCVGAWTPDLVSLPRLPLEIERTVQFWFEPAAAGDPGEGRDGEPSEPGDPADLEPGRCPVWVWEHEPGGEWYGFPRRGTSMKVGIHLAGDRRTTADTVDRVVSLEEREAMRALLRRHMALAAGACARADVCLYTTTPDRRFVLDRHPHHPEAVLFSGGSGHAFKFAPVLGEILADLATDVEPGFDISPLSISRFGHGGRS